MIIFFFNDTATTEIYTLSLHDALPISAVAVVAGGIAFGFDDIRTPVGITLGQGEGMLRLAGMLGYLAVHLLVVDRKSTRLNSSHANISYAVFCLKKKKNHV